MYAIRSYYGGVEPQKADIPVYQADSDKDKLQVKGSDKAVITSYSIHYTKLYEALPPDSYPHLKKQSNILLSASLPHTSGPAQKKE